MPLHPSILFHFTKSLDNLKAILLEAFKPSYANETIRGIKKDGAAFEKEFAVPIVSFCDLRVSELQDHIENYGRFGIGLTKSWALNNGLHPVFYINEKNRLIPNFLDGLSSRFDRILNSYNSGDFDNSYKEEYDSFFRIQAFLKHYQGDLKRRDGSIRENYLFADEREWRYVPEFDVFDEEEYALSFVGNDVMNKANWKEKWNEKLPNEYRLHFQPKDIKYLIVENDDDALKLVDHLKNVKALRFNFDEDTISLLASRILTCEQIWNDI